MKNPLGQTSGESQQMPGREKERRKPCQAQHGGQTPIAQAATWWGGVFRGRARKPKVSEKAYLGSD